MGIFRFWRNTATATAITATATANATATATATATALMSLTLLSNCIMRFNLQRLVHNYGIVFGQMNCIRNPSCRYHVLLTLLTANYVMKSSGLNNLDKRKLIRLCRSNYILDRYEY